MQNFLFFIVLWSKMIRNYKSAYEICAVCLKYYFWMRISLKLTGKRNNFAWLDSCCYEYFNLNICRFDQSEIQNLQKALICCSFFRNTKILYLEKNP